MAWQPEPHSVTTYNSLHALTPALSGTTGHTKGRFGGGEREGMDCTLPCKPFVHVFRGQKNTAILVSCYILHAFQSQLCNEFSKDKVVLFNRILIYFIIHVFSKF